MRGQPTEEGPMLGDTEHPRILFVSTFPPTACGLATFTQSMIRAMSQQRPGAEALAVARLRSAGEVPISLQEEVAVDLSVASGSWPERIGRIAEGYDMLWIQHEFGVFGGEDGLRVLDLLDATCRPIITTFHSVLADPTCRQRLIVERLLQRSIRSVVMSEVARARLIHTHGPSRRLMVVPHGAHRFRAGHRRTSKERPIITTWGLLGPGKGIEWGIEAMARLRNLDPLPRYLIRGATHPKVLESEGESYRRGLASRIADLGLSDLVDIRSGYVPHEELADVVAHSDLALLPYDSREQVTSGVLAEAIAAGIPVVATAFPHAVELLRTGPGLIVAHGDPDAMAAALMTLLTDPIARGRAAAAALRLGESFSWSAVGRQCEALAAAALAEVPAVPAGSTGARVG